MPNQKIYLAALGAVPKITTETWLKIVGYFPDLETAWKASGPELQAAGIKDRFIVELIEFRKSNQPDSIMERLTSQNIKLISLLDKEYPAALKEIHNPPFLLYVIGEIKPEDQQAIAVVGSRRCTDYGRRVTAEIVTSLAKRGITIISGLALGIDTEAHQAAVRSGGRTLAVLANGLDQVYPSSNTNLAKEIIKNGAIISEQPLGIPAYTQNFPARNRIISGLSVGVLITEASDKSGTIHTANFALEQNRQIYAVPGPIYNPLSVGPNRLLKMGAKAVLEGQDILEDFGLDCATTEKPQPENDQERLIFEILADEPKHIDMIAREAELPSSEISQTLSLMEINGKLRHLGGMIYGLR